MPRAKWLDSQSLADVQVHVSGDTAAAVMKYSQTGATPGKRDISGNFLITGIWIKTAGGGRVAERHSSHQEKTPI